jgi:hypothetical protein
MRRLVQRFATAPVAVRALVWLAAGAVVLIVALLVALG